MNENKNLIVDAEVWSNNYDLNFTPFIDAKEIRGREFEYLSWSAATKFLKERHPNFQVKFVINPETNNYLFKISYDTNLDKIVEHCKDDTVALDFYNALKDLDRGGGYYVESYIEDLETGAVSDSYFYSLLDFKNQPIYLPTTTDLNNNMQRSLVKTIAIVTGIGLRLFTREDIDDENGNKTAKFKGLLALYPAVQIAKRKNQIEQEPDFSWTVEELKDLKQKFIDLGLYAPAKT